MSEPLPAVPARSGAPRMKDVAARAGVSVKTVSNYVNGYPYMRPETRERIRTAITELGYRVNPTARGLRSGRTGMLGLVLPELDQPYFSELAQHTALAAEELGYRVFTEVTRGRRDLELDVLSGSRCRAVDGMVFCPLALGPQDVPLFAVDFPMVVIGERISGSPVPHVAVENVAGARTATAHLLRQGRRRVLALGADRSELGAWQLRLQGYREAHAAAGLPADPSLVTEVAGLWHSGTGAAAVEAALRDGPEFDAVFAFNDALALGALHALHRAGRRVPEDVAVVGFDATDAGRYAVPGLTSVDPGLPEVARHSVDLVVARISGCPVPDGAVVPHRLVVRESCGAG